MDNRIETSWWLESLKTTLKLFIIFNVLKIMKVMSRSGALGIVGLTEWITAVNTDLNGTSM